MQLEMRVCHLLTLGMNLSRSISTSSNIRLRLVVSGDWCWLDAEWADQWNYNLSLESAADGTTNDDEN